MMVMSWTSLLGLMWKLEIWFVPSAFILSYETSWPQKSQMMKRTQTFAASKYIFIVIYCLICQKLDTESLISWVLENLTLFVMLISIQHRGGSGGVYLDLSSTQLHNGTLWLFSTWENHVPKDWIISKYWFDKLCLNLILFQLCMNQIG